MSRQNKLIWQLRNPSDWPEVLYEVQVHRRSHVGRTICNLTRTHQDWRMRSQTERLSRLNDWYNRLAANQNVWIDRLVRDVGKPVEDAKAEVQYGLDLVKNINAQWESDSPSSRFKVRYHPHGLVGLITGDGITGDILVRSPEVKALSFTGSIAVGRKIAHSCGRMARPFQAEMGGNNAAIIMADADIEAVAQELAPAMFSFSGQRCTAIRRVIVEEGVFNQFAEAFCEVANNLIIGPPGDRATQIGPVISRQSQRSLVDTIQRAVKEGGELLAGTRLPNNLGDRGCWIAPTVLSNLHPESPVIRDELFGPVVALISAKNLRHAMDIHNHVEQGLLGALFSKCRESQEYFLNNAQAGMLILNHARPQFDSAAPFIGWKASGFGCPEHGRWDRDFYAKVQTLYG